MSILVAWVAFPLLLIGLAIGCGLLLERLVGVRLPGVLLAGSGVAVIVVTGQFAALSPASAELATPLAVALAVAGFGLAGAARLRGVDPWGAIAAAAVFAVYAAPIVASGSATFAGYIRLDDTATWMALTDRIVEHGRSLEGLAPSTYEATLAFNLADGYPIGVFIPLGIGRALVAQDVAWLIQPYMALLGALLALAIWSLASPLVGDRRLRAGVAFIAAQPGLLFGYYLWGGIKEVAAAALIATAVALLGVTLRERFSSRSLVPVAVLCAAVIGVLSAGGAIWLLPLVITLLTLGLRELGVTTLVRRATLPLVLGVGLCAPVLAGGLLPPTSSSLTDPNALGSLVEPLSLAQVAGIWPAGDFRLSPDHGAGTAILVGLAIAAACGGAVLAWRRRAWPLLVFSAGSLIAGFALVAIGSPWVGGKALATASAAIPLLAAIVAATLIASGWRIEGVALVALLAFGVLWSNALAYRDANLAPRDQLAELEQIGDAIAGEGPALMTEYQPYGARHFLREADAEAASELRRRRVPLRDGGTLEKGLWADTDEFDLDGLTEYRTLVLRRSPVQSRPPAPYRLAFSGDYYDVWQRRIDETVEVAEHLPLGDALDPAGRAHCGAVRRLARRAGDDGTIAFAERPPTVAVSAGALDRPHAWKPGSDETLLPSADGTAAATVSLPESGTWRAWLGGSVRGRIDLRVDGAPAGSVRHLLNNDGLFAELGSVALEAGEHLLELDYSGADLLHPGSGGRPERLGPLILTLDASEEADPRRIDAADATELCGRRLDWIAALR